MVETFLAEPRELERDVGVGQEDLLPVLVRLRRHRFPEQVLPGLGVLGGGELRLLVEAGIVEGVLDPDRPAERVGLVGEHLGEDHPAAVLRGHEEAVAAGAHRRADIADDAVRADPVVRCVCCHVMVPK